MSSTSVVLIAGGTGFLGSHLCDYYVSKGNQVICLDNFSTSDGENVAHLLKKDNFSFINHDITKPFPRDVVGTTYNIIINMASPASPPHYQRLAAETLEVGSTGTKNLLELARRDGARFFHASTSEVYGDPEIHPQPETYKGSVNSYGPRSMYDEAKRYAESLIYVYRNNYGVDTTIARFFNTYGPRMDPDDGRVVSNFIVQALQHRPLTIYGDGSQTRSFCYVDDLIEGIVALIDSQEEGPINLGNPDEFTVKQLAEKVLQLTSSNSILTYLPLPGDDPLQRKPAIELAKQRLHWTPVVNLDIGLVKTIEYFKKAIEKT